MAMGHAGAGDTSNPAAEALIAFDQAMLSTQQGLGVLEKKFKRVVFQIRTVYMPIRNAAEGFAKMTGALTGLRDIKETDSWLLRIGGSILKMIPGQKELTDAVQSWMGVLQDDEGNMTRYDKFLAVLKIGGLSILTIIVSVVGGILAVVAILGLLSLAIQGANSPFYEFYENLSNSEKLLVGLSALAAVVYLIAGGLTGLVGGIIILYAVATGKFDAFYSVVVTVLTVIGITIALLVMGVSLPFAIAFAAILGLIALYIRFQDKIDSGLAYIRDGAVSIANTIGTEFMKMYNKYIKPWWEPLMEWKTGGGFTGYAARSAAKSYSQSQTNNVTVNMNGSGSSSDGHRIGRDIGRAIQDESRRQGGAPTRGAI